MKILLDECVDVRLRTDIVGHDVFTVAFMGWKGIHNGRLLALAAADGFDALITTDRGYEHQQNLATLPVAIVIVMAPSNDFDDVRLFVPSLLTALQTLAPRSLVRVS